MNQTANTAFFILCCAAGVTIMCYSTGHAVLIAICTLTLGLVPAFVSFCDYNEPNRHCIECGTMLHEQDHDVVCNECKYS